MMPRATVVGMLAALLAPAGEVKRSSFAGLYQPRAVNARPSIPAYSLPLDPAKISNREAVARHFDLKRIDALLARNGFGVLPSAFGDDLVEPYKRLKELQLPVLVTADTLLHLYHVQFGETLKEIEQQVFLPLLERLTAALLDDAVARHGGLDGALKEAARRNIAYFAVARKLLDPEAAIPAEAATAVEAELRLIAAHAGWSPSPVFVYQEDYSQYVPRGHYTQSEILGRYFRAMMWYGRMGFLLKNSDLLPAPNAEIQTLAASLMAEALAGSEMFAAWDRIYTVTAFYVGLADDLTPDEYSAGIREVAGAAAELADPQRFTALRAWLAKLPNPRIYGGTGACTVGAPYDPAQIDECLDKSKGLRFMGQRFVPDSYIFQNLVGMDYLGRGAPFTMVQTMAGAVRGFPRGLDVMDLLGSERARAILEAEGDTEYRNYEEQRRKLVEEFGAFTETDWNRNLYWSWLYALRALLAPCGEGYPTFMQTGAWRDKSLSTALASWVELRHDTILYAKQSYTPIRTSLPPPVRGYVEPVPEFYSRLLALTRMTQLGLEQLEVLSEAARARLERLAAILERLTDLSVRELENQPLGEADYAFLREIGQALESAVLGVPDAGVKTALIADVHTDGNSGQVLEQGVGNVDLLAAVVLLPDGELTLVLGPVLSYYEFKWPMGDRLTDEAWRERLAGGAPARPAWTDTFLAAGR